MTTQPTRSRRVKLGAVFIVIALCALATIAIVAQRLRTARHRWKEAAIPAISAWAADASWRAQQIHSLTNAGSNPSVIAQGWLTDKFILMENGEWLAYKSHCSKESPYWAKDIYLAKGSNGKWYYSTFHFCVGMCVLVMEQETQPRDLPKFVHDYNLQEFDGRSDQCLSETKPFPASWYEGKTNGR